jgi:archaemetzincin
MKAKRFFLPLRVLFVAAALPASAGQQVFIQPLAYVDQAVLERVSSALSSVFAVEVKVASELALPASAYYAPRQRYRADRLLDFLNNLDIAVKGQVVGVTEKDISVSKGAIPDWGIFGYGFAPGRVCVVSTFRLRHGRASRELFLQRLERVALHELAHTFGLLHCPTAGCLMEDARGTIRTVDLSDGRFCPSCCRQLGTQLKNH